MITKYNLFTVNEWIFKTPKSVLYQKILAFLLCTIVKIAHFFAFLQRFC